MDKPLDLSACWSLYSFFVRTPYAYVRNLCPVNLSQVSLISRPQLLNIKGYRKSFFLPTIFYWVLEKQLLS